MIQLNQSGEERDDLIRSLRQLAQEMLEDGDSYVAYYGRKLLNLIDDRAS